MAAASGTCGSSSVGAMRNLQFSGVGSLSGRWTSGRLVYRKGFEAGKRLVGVGRRGRVLDVQAASDDVEKEKSTASTQSGKLSSTERSKTTGSKKPRRPSLSVRAGKQRSADSRTSWKFPNLIEEWTSFLAPREKGDVRDVVLMSFSFAVLIYISQHLVHAYCTLRHMYHF